MKIVYISHPLGGIDFDINLLNAASWVGYLAERYDIAPIADWIILAKEWKGDDKRERGLQIDCKLVTVCDELWMVGGKVSNGMKQEANTAIGMCIPVRNLTNLGYFLQPGKKDWINLLDRLVDEKVENDPHQYPLT